MYTDYSLIFCCASLISENAGSQNLQYFVARLFPNISDAPLRLPGKSVKHQFETATDVVENIFKFYSTEALKQFYKIVGALDIVGNPTMLVTSLVSGIRDFVLTPSTALMNSPTDPSRLGIGVAQVRFSGSLEVFCSNGIFLTQDKWANSPLGYLVVSITRRQWNFRLCF